MSQEQDPFSDVPTEGTPDMWGVGNEGATPSDVVMKLLGGDYKDILSVIMRSNYETEECMTIVRVLRRAKFGLGLIIKDANSKEWAMPWLKQAVVDLSMTRMSVGFHSVNKAVEALSSMKTKSEQTIKMSNL